MKNFAIFFAVLFFVSSQSFAYSSRYDSFYFKPAATIEYQAPHISGGGANSDFKNNNLGKQVTSFENIAIGGFFKFSHRIGVNLNWVKTGLHNSELQGVAISQVARFKMQQINLSGVYLFPIINDFAEVFGEAGLSDMRSELKYATSSEAVKKSKNEIMPFIGAGFQIKPFKSQSKALRFSVQRYIGQVDLLDSSYTTVRVGFVKYF
ncbi:MAG: hypothetical protein FJ368_06880 [Pelagibacterales bacterium]|nr:hypothetical protein [Pelagibacterales bacterium]